MKTNLVYGKVADLFPRPGSVVIADDFFRGREFFAGCPTIWIHACEGEKTLATAERIIGALIELEADRDTMLIGVGGGVTTDLAGFVASVYKRGVPFGLVPTTLLAQVDAAIGGKNGVNFDRFKNMVGCFRQPEFVYIDTGLLATLPPRALRCGAAEMLKTFLIADADSYAEAVEVFREPQPQVPVRLVRRAAEIKSRLVAEDPLDRGVRRLLNLGHTFGHAIEKCTSDLQHGEAVAVGIVMAARLACEKGLLDEATADRIRSDFASAGLPVTSPVPEEQLRQAMRQDKKRSGTKEVFVLPDAIGHATIWESSVTA